MVVDSSVPIDRGGSPKIFYFSNLDALERPTFVEEALVVVGPVETRHLCVPELVDELGRVVHTDERSGGRADMNSGPVGALDRDYNRR